MSAEPEVEKRDPEPLQEGVEEEEAVSLPLPLPDPVEESPSAAVAKGPELTPGGDVMRGPLGEGWVVILPGGICVFIEWRKGRYKETTGVLTFHDGKKTGAGSIIAEFPDWLGVMDASIAEANGLLSEE